jgi:hypothetical protein
VAVRPTVSACALGIVLFTVASRLQKRMKAGVEAISVIDRLKASLKSLAQLFSGRLHGFAALPTHAHG